jgi:hypothetical protein
MGMNTSWRKLERDPTDYVSAKFIFFHEYILIKINFKGMASNFNEIFMLPSTPNDLCFDKNEFMKVNIV